MRTIEIYSDLVCPWCYIGKRRLEKALGDAGDVKVVWKPFELNPNLPREGMDRQEYRSKKFGSAERSAQLERNVTEVAKGEGLDFALEKIRRTPNTFDGHRLLRFARDEGREEALSEALFRAYFTEGRDLGDRAVLEEIAAGVGLGRERVRAFLANDELHQEVRREEAEGLALGVQGVPFFVFNGKVGLSGAHGPDVILGALKQSEGETCGPDGCET